MDLSWVPATFKPLATGTVGGLVAYWLAQRRFIAERRWERLYDLYCEIFDALNALEHCLTTVGDKPASGPDEAHAAIAVEAVATFEANLLKVNQFQERLMLLGADAAHVKLMTLYAALSAVRPWVANADRGTERTAIGEIIDLIKSSRRLVQGTNGELAFVARRDLAIGPRPARFRSPFRRMLRRKRDV